VLDKLQLLYLIKRNKKQPEAHSRLGGLIVLDNQSTTTALGASKGQMVRQGAELNAAS